MGVIHIYSQPRKEETVLSWALPPSAMHYLRTTRQTAWVVRAPWTALQEIQPLWQSGCRGPLCFQLKLRSEGVGLNLNTKVTWTKRRCKVVKVLLIPQLLPCLARKKRVHKWLYFKKGLCRAGWKECIRSSSPNWKRKHHFLIHNGYRRALSLLCINLNMYG